VLKEQTRYDVHVAHGAFAAGAECEKFRPHVMLLDVHMPEAESGAFCAFVRGSEDLQMTKIIGMSSRLTDGQINQLVGRGYDSVLRKPFTVRQVIDMIENAHALVA
jgi:CheY-like chemotaxis protein